MICEEKAHTHLSQISTGIFAFFVSIQLFSF